MKFLSLSLLALSLVPQFAFAKTCSLVESQINPDGTYTRVQSVVFQPTANPYVFKAETSQFAATVWLKPRGASCEITGPQGGGSRGSHWLPEGSHEQPSISLVKGTKLDIYDIGFSAKIDCEK